MTTEDAELDLLIEHRERTARFHKAKDAAVDGGPKAQETWAAEKAEMREWRRQWREVRAAFSPAAAEGDATASPDPLAMKGKVH